MHNDRNTSHCYSEFMQDVGALSSLDTKSRGLLSSNLASGLTSSDWKTRKSQHDTSERSIGDIHAETATEKKVRLDEEEKNR